LAWFEGPTPPNKSIFALVCLDCVNILTLKSPKILEKMARRRHSLAIYGAESTAKQTIQHFEEKVKEARANPAVRDKWISKYFNGIESYAEDPLRTAEAETKLATWYSVLETDVAPSFSQTMSEARATYYKRLAEKYRRAAEEATSAEHRKGSVSMRV